MNENKDLNLTTVAKLLEASPSLSPVIIGFIVHEFIKDNQTIDARWWPYIIFITIASSIFIFSWQQSNKHYKANSDFLISKDLHTRINDIDSHVKGRAVEGLQVYRLLTENVDDVVEMRSRAFINTTAVNALMPSIIQNHHCVEIDRYNDVKAYLDSKVKLIELAFNRDPYRAKYLETLISKLPDNVTLHKAFQSYVYMFFKEALLPALIDACISKIAYYKSIEARTSISKEYKLEIVGHRERNERYLKELESIDGESAISTTAGISREK